MFFMGFFFITVCVYVIISEQFFYFSDVKRFVYCNCNVTFVSSGENFLIILKTVQLLCAWINLSS